MKLESVWIVRDPTKHSTVEHCLFEQPLERIDRYVMGSPLNSWCGERHTVYTTHEEALVDATARLARGPVPGKDAPAEESWERVIATAKAGGRGDDAPPHTVISRILGAGLEQRYDRALSAARDLQSNANSLVKVLVEDGIGAATSGNGYGGSARHVTEALAELSVAREAFGTAYRASERTPGR